LENRSRQAYDTGMRLLRTVGLAEKALNYPDELSGGQKQRIAIARTLAMDPDVILLDEPTSALDPTMVGEVQAVIRDLAKTGKTMMIVTHEMNFAKAISNRVFYMDEGGICEDGTPEQIFDHPQRENTRRFVRRLKVLELNIESRDYDFPGHGGRDRYLVQQEPDRAEACESRPAGVRGSHGAAASGAGKPARPDGLRIRRADGTRGMDDPLRGRALRRDGLGRRPCPRGFEGHDEKRGIRLG
jgi:amino acid ABC transporter ATP-binding protein, PAAT family (TC 3.A.1.3.-)